MDLVQPVAWYATYHYSKHLNIKDKQNQTLVSGCLSGLAVALTSLPFQARMFPETLKDLRAQPYGNFGIKSLSLMSGHCVFWLVYEGLSKNAKAQPERRPIDWMTMAMSGFIGGLGYRAVSVSFYTGPVTNPLQQPGGWKLIAKSSLSLTLAVLLGELVM